MNQNQNNNPITVKNESSSPDNSFFLNIEKIPSFKIYSNCKLCNSPIRQQAEELYVQTRNISHVHRFLEQNDNKISWSCVRNHLLSHLTSALSQERIESYCQNMAEWCSIERKKEQRLEALISMLERRIIQLAAVADGRDDAESVKISETVAKLSSAILSIQQQIDDYRKTTEPVKIVIEKIQQIVQVQLSATPSQEVRKVLMNVVDVLEHDLGGLIENGQN